MADVLTEYIINPNSWTTINAVKEVIGFDPVSIIIPTLGKRDIRPLLHQLENCAYLGEQEVIVQIDENKEGVAVTTKKGIERASHDFIAWLADDTMPQPYFLNHAMITYKTAFEDGIGLVAFNDGCYYPSNGMKAASHFLTNKKLLELLIDNELFHPMFRHQGTDGFLHAQCHILGKFAYSELAEVRHFPIDDESRVISREHISEDRDLEVKMLNQLYNEHQIPWIKQHADYLAAMPLPN